MSEFQFTYKPDATHESNFVEWRTLNAEERSAYGEALLTMEEAIVIFQKMYGKGDLSVDLLNNQ
jgi:hypothetical protein